MLAYATRLGYRSGRLLARACAASAVRLARFSAAQALPLGRGQILDGELLFLSCYEALNSAPALFLADDGRWVLTLSRAAICALLDAWIDAQPALVWGARPLQAELEDRWYWCAFALKRSGGVPSVRETTDYLGLRLLMDRLIVDASRRVSGQSLIERIENGAA